MFAARLSVACACFLALGSCSDWSNQSITVHGIRFTKFRTDDAGFAIGWIPQDTMIASRLCRKGWVHLHPSGIPAGFTAAEPIALGDFTIPAHTWVRQTPAAVITLCAFPSDTKIQGHWVHGTGGPKGTQTTFYPSGGLRQFYPVQDTRIDGVPCRANPFQGWVELHENGRLKSAQLAADWTQGAVKRRAGTRIIFDADGQLVSRPLGPVGG
jgi:hypothetical protein